MNLERNSNQLIVIVRFKNYLFRWLEIKKEKKIQSRIVHWLQNLFFAQHCLRRVHDTSRNESHDLPENSAKQQRFFLPRSFFNLFPRHAYLHFFFLLFPFVFIFFLVSLKTLEQRRHFQEKMGVVTTCGITSRRDFAYVSKFLFFFLLFRFFSFFYHIIAPTRLNFLIENITPERVYYFFFPFSCSLPFSFYFIIFSIVNFVF